MKDERFIMLSNIELVTSVFPIDKKPFEVGDTIQWEGDPYEVIKYKLSLDITGWHIDSISLKQIINPLTNTELEIKTTV